jgi:hypothetical protein
MEHLVKPKISISRLILTVSITIGVIIYGAYQLAKERLNRRSESIPDHYSRQSEDTATAAYQMDTSLVLDKLTAKQIIEAVSKFHHIPVDYRGERLAKQDACFAGTIYLDGDIKDIVTLLNRLGIYVKYDRKKIIAGE